MREGNILQEIKKLTEVEENSNGPVSECMPDLKENEITLVKEIIYKKRDLIEEAQKEYKNGNLEKARELNEGSYSFDSSTEYLGKLLAEKRCRIPENILALYKEYCFASIGLTNKIQKSRKGNISNFKK